MRSFFEYSRNFRTYEERNKMEETIERVVGLPSKIEEITYYVEGQAGPQLLSEAFDVERSVWRKDV
jgi:hypothetical protein